ncbi:transcription initiation protein SPT3 homolog isoform X3 [Haemaphysalis longicornis]
MDLRLEEETALGSRMCARSEAHKALIYIHQRRRHRLFLPTTRTCSFPASPSANDQVDADDKFTGSSDAGSSAAGSSRPPTPSSAAGSSGGSGGNAGAAAGASSSSSATPSSSSAPQNAWVLEEIQGMMHGFGDCRRPLQESVRLVADIVKQQLKSLFHQAAAVASLRGSKCLGVEDVLFLLRKDKVKLGRLIRYLEHKSLQGYVFSRLPMDEDDVPSAPLVSPEAGEGPSSSSADPNSAGSPRFKRTKICRDFIASIDQTGELASVFTDSFLDGVKQERDTRADARTRYMDRAQYMDYCSARASSFCRKNKVARFKEWLLQDIQSESRLSPSAVEVFNYMAFETVAQIVDLCLLIKKERKDDPSDPMSWSMPSLAGNPGQLFDPQDKPVGPTAESSMSKDGSNDTGVFLEYECITPDEIMEAMQRYWTWNGPMASFGKLQMQGPRKRLLSC